MYFDWGFFRILKRVSLHVNALRTLHKLGSVLSGLIIRREVVFVAMHEVVESNHIS